MTPHWIEPLWFTRIADTLCWCLSAAILVGMVIVALHLEML